MAKTNSTPVNHEWIDLTDEIDKCLNQAEAICALASKYVDFYDEVPDVTLDNAMWAARDLIRNSHGLVSKLAEIAGNAKAKVSNIKAA